jgi:iron uptake system component EfeO
MLVKSEFILVGIFAGLALSGCGNDDDNSALTDGDDVSVEPDSMGDTGDSGTGDTGDSDTGDSDTDPEDGEDAGDAVPDPEVEAILAVKRYVAQELVVLSESARAIQNAAPDADEDGWNAEDDGEALNAMREAWKGARAAYEKVEGAIAVIFPNYDASTDERYDGFIEEGADDNLFDGEGVTGVHAIERILWADSHPEQVVDFESALPNYVEAAFPSNEQQADAFKNDLVQRLVDDTAAMEEQFEPLALDAPSAFRGVVGSMEEQLEKVALAATGEDESRYAQHTLSDMRANLEGGEQIFGAFVPWLEAEGEADLAEAIANAFDVVSGYYEDLDGDAIPEVPADWDPDDPSEEDLNSDYGTLFSKLSGQADPDDDASLVGLMLQAADALGIVELEE